MKVPKIRLGADPMGERNPFQVYMLLLSLLSGFTTLLADVPATTGSIEYYLNRWEEIVWATLLILGSASTLVGMFWYGTERDALLVKRLGLTTLSVPLAVYAFVLVGRFGWSSLSIALAILGFAGAAFVQAWRVNKAINRAIQEFKEDGHNGA